MYKYLLFSLVIVLFCGCKTAKQTSNGSVHSKTDKATKVQTAKVVENEEGKWVLLAPNDSVVAFVFVQQGSTRPDEFKNGMIRIVNKEGLVGFASESGQIKIQPCYLAATPFKGRVAAVTPASQSRVATDDAVVGTLTGDEHWGVVNSDGMYMKNPVYLRSWDDKIADFIYTSSASTFWIDEDGEIHE